MEGRVLMCILRIMPAAIIPRPWDFADRPKGVVPATSAPSDAKAPATAPVPGEKASPTLPLPPPKAVSGSSASPAPAAHDELPGVVNPAPGSA
jgi:hypothetical protein